MFTNTPDETNLARQVLRQRAKMGCAYWQRSKGYMTFKKGYEMGSVHKKYEFKFSKTNLHDKVKEYFMHFGKESVYEHSIDVLREIEFLKRYFDFDLEKCMCAAILHDVGRVVEREDLIDFCEENGYEVQEEERKAPSILHQVASMIIGEKIFLIEDREVLGAIRYHTTLKGNPTEVEKIVFLSDKLSWKEKEYETSVEQLREISRSSYNEAIYFYQEEMYRKRDEMICYHRSSREAYEYFREMRSALSAPGDTGF